MGDMREVYDAMKKHSKQKKSSNLATSTAMLDREQIDYISKNNGVHLIVTDFNGNLIDFWPSTGKWIVRNGITSRGVQNLIRYIKEK